MEYIKWVVLYLIFSLIFAQCFKETNRDMKNASALTILLEVFTAIFALLLSPLFTYKFSVEPKILLTLGAVTIIYAATDRLNIEARYGLAPSTFSMLKQLSTVFMVIFGFAFLKEKIIFSKIMGIILILLANILLSTNKKGKLELNKYFIMCIISNFLFAIAMFINVNISDNFNIGLYTVITVLIPAFIIKIVSKLSIKDLKQEFKLYDKKKFMLVSFSWAMMLISSVKAYEYGNISIVAPLLTLSMVTNSIYEYFIDKDKNSLKRKLAISLLIVIGIILIKK
ncbi:MAG: hypothetical protein Q4C33_03045 [bacterium]|nr:hypothetical protein [bacterium]